LNTDRVSRRIAAITLIGGLGGGLVFPILPALGFRLGIPGFMVGLILAANRIARLVFNAPAGHLIQRLGARRILTGALAVETVGILGYSAALRSGHPAAWLLAGRTLFGVGTAFLMVGAQAAVLSLSRREDRGRKTASVRMAMGAAAPVGLILGGTLADLFSEDTAFLTAAAITLGGAILAAAALPPMAARPGGGARRGGYAALLASPNRPLLAAAWGFNLLVFLTMQGVLLSTLVILMQQRHIHLLGLQAQGTSGIVMAVLMGCSALAAYGLGRALDTAGLRSNLLFPALAGLAAGFAVLALGHTLGLTLLGAVLVGLSYNGVTVPMLALLGDAVGDHHHGPAVGVNQIFGDIGGSLGPIVGLEAAVNVGLTPLYLGLALLAALGLPAAVWLRGRERGLRPPAP